MAGWFACHWYRRRSQTQHNTDWSFTETFAWQEPAFTSVHFRNLLRSVSVRVCPRTISGNIAVVVFVMSQWWHVEATSIFVWHIVPSVEGVTIVHWISFSFFNTVNQFKNSNYMWWPCNSWNVKRLYQIKYCIISNLYKSLAYITPSQELSSILGFCRM